jgi:hypothetical protein
MKKHDLILTACWLATAAIGLVSAVVIALKGCAQ